MFNVKVRGSWFPRTIFGRFVALCAYIRCILAALALAWSSRGAQRYDVVIVDQVSAVIPVLKMFTSARILFYCHFPDLLLATPKSTLHALYRLPIDWIEQTTTGMADLIAVNSAFTQRIFEDTFYRLARRGIKPQILYPAVHPPTDADLQAAQKTCRKALPDKSVAMISGGPTFLSINRFERKKNIALAIDALALLVKTQAQRSEEGEEEQPSTPGAPPPGPRLIIAGGYDARLAENVQHLRELGHHAADVGVRDRVTFVPSFTDEQRAALLAGCVAVLYTPMGEHFGIVPLEAMAAARPVVACNSGGPLESVVNGETGFLKKPLPEEWAAAMAELLKEGVAEKMGRQARKHVLENFSRRAFGDKLDGLVLQLAGKKAKTL